MASQGPNSPGTGANDASAGTSAWTNPGNVLSSNSSYAQHVGAPGDTFVDKTVQMVKGGTISGNNNSAGAAIPASQSYRTFGSPSDLWGLTWTDTDINASDFGVVYQSTATGPTDSQYLKATNFGFSVSSGATIDGIIVEIGYAYDGFRRNNVDHIRITVYYTAGGGGGKPAQYYQMMRNG